MIDSKSVSRTDFSFINTYSALCFLKFFGKTHVSSVYRPAAQQQTITSRPKKFTLFYVKISAKFNKFSFKRYK